MTPIEFWCEAFARLLFWAGLACALYGCWVRRQGRAIDAYLGGVQKTIYL